MKTTVTKLLGDNDPEPVSIISKPGKIIFSGPHNGRSVPECLPPFMGTNENWFNNAHDAHDLHMDKVFTALDKSFDDASLIWGNYSRLLFDLNTMPDYAINPRSSENGNIIIPANQTDQCCTKQRSLRFNEIYCPYHGAKTQLINEKRNEHGGVIVIDMHSFTPTWDQVKRNVEVGTIRCEKTPLSQEFENYLKHMQDEFLFVSGEPYRVAQRLSNAAALITDNNDLQYLGLEIRNDLIATDEGIDKIVTLLKNITQHLSQPEFIDVTKRRTEISSQIPPKHDDIYGSCPIL